jgi:hypothetical protein
VAVWCSLLAAGTPPGFHDSRHQRIGAVLDFSEQEARVVHTVIVNFGG